VEETWQPYSYSPDKSSPAPLAEQGAAPLLVQQLAASQLRSLQEGASLASLALEAAEAADLPDLLGVVVDGKPLQIPMSDWLSQSPMPLASEPRKTLSSSESGQVRRPNGTFGPIEEVQQ